MRTKSRQPAATALCFDGNPARRPLSQLHKASPVAIGMATQPQTNTQNNEDEAYAHSSVTLAGR